MAKYIKTEDAIPYLTKYIPSVEAVEREKIDKAKRIAEDSIRACFKLGLSERAFGMREMLEVFESIIGGQK